MELWCNVHHWVIQFKALKALSWWIFPADGWLLLVHFGTLPLKCSTLSIQHITWASGLLHFYSTFFWAPEFALILRWCKFGIKPQSTGSTPSCTDLCKQEVCLSQPERPCWFDKLDDFQVIFTSFFSFSYCSLARAKGLATLRVYRDVRALVSDSLQANDDKCGGKERWLLENDLRKQNLQQ